VTAPVLVGRDQEIAAMESLLALVAIGGGSLLVLGDPGIGKSALAETASWRARDRGMRVLACAGAASEAHVSFAGLHQLLRPVLAEADGLPRSQHDALLTALGMADGPAPALPLVGLATLELLAAGAVRAPVLVVAEDVHWLDVSTCEVLAFVGRRLGADPVALLGTARDIELKGNPVARAGLPELRLEPLGAADSAALLDARAMLDPVVRQRVLDEAAGNPLALVELPLAAADRFDRADPSGPIPLTRRLERAFASRLPGLPEVTLTALLAAGLDDADALEEVLAAASRVTGAPVLAADLAADPRTRQRMTSVAGAIPVNSDDPKLLFVLALADPAGRGARVLARIGRHRPGSGSPVQDMWLGLAALGIGACGQVEGFLDAAEAGERARGELVMLARVLLGQAWVKALLGRADLAGTAAEECCRLQTEVGNPVWAACAQAVLSMLAGRRGDAATATGLADQAEKVLVFAGVPPLLAQVQLARGIAALGAGRYREAYEELVRIFDQADTAYHPYLRAWALLDLAEAASHSGDQDAVRAWCAALTPEAAATGSPLLRASLAVAAPLLAEGDDAGPLFDQAFSVDLADWPLHRARLQLAYGMWLRRRYQVTDARVPLRAARDTFDALSATPWAQRARQELEAAGEHGGPATRSMLDLLAPQELQIARLAAQGLSNKQIGQQLYLSHRTVSTHLYRTFPKLGITSRAQLAAALVAPQAPA
jgi:DNA-binding CsgD family transcriptional regulator